MPTPGYYFRDGGATPPLEAGQDNEVRQRITNAARANEAQRARLEAQKPVTATAQAPLGQNTSTSHQLATDAHMLGGAVQNAGKKEPNRTTNLGWQANAVGVDTLVHGLPNAELWTLVRRFNKAYIPSPSLQYVLLMYD